MAQKTPDELKSDITALPISYVGGVSETETKALLTDIVDSIGSGGGGEYVPLEGTATNSPITGNIELLQEAIIKIYKEDEYGNYNSITFWDDPTLSLENKFTDTVSKVTLQGSVGLQSMDNTNSYRTNLEVGANRFMVENVGDETVSMDMQQGAITFVGNIIVKDRLTVHQVKVDTSFIVNESGEYVADLFHNNESGVPTVFLHSQNTDEETSASFQLRENFISFDASEGTNGSSITLHDGKIETKGDVEIKDSGTLTFEGLNNFTDETLRTTLIANSGSTDVVVALPYQSGQLPVFDTSNTIDFRDATNFVTQKDGYLGGAVNVSFLRTLIDDTTPNTSYNGYDILESVKQDGIITNTKCLFNIQHIYSFTQSISDTNGAIDLLFVVRDGDGSVRGEKVISNIPLQPFDSGIDDSSPENTTTPVFIEIVGSFGNHRDNHNTVKIVGDGICRTATVANGDFDGTVHSEIYYKKHGSYTGSVSIRKYIYPQLTQSIVREL